MAKFKWQPGGWLPFSTPTNHCWLYCGFLLPQSNLVIEVDGSSHDGQEQYDEERERVLFGWGLKVIRFSNDQVLNQMPEVLKIIRRNL